MQFPKLTTQSVKRATVLQYFEVDFIRAMGIISPAAATYSKAVIAGVHRDLAVYRRRDTSTTNWDWTGKTVEEAMAYTCGSSSESWHSSTAGISVRVHGNGTHAET